MRSFNILIKMTMPKLWVKSFLTVAVLESIFIQSEAILRNSATGRCLHLGYNESVQKDGPNVYTNQCTFMFHKLGQKVNQDQWVEIIPVSSEGQKYVIQKFDTDNLVCVNTIGKSISIGDCKSSHSSFIFKKLGNSSELSGDSFTIEQPLGMCLTVLPGSQRVVMKNCSQANTDPLQRWIACRHIRACDVEISWSPSRIAFPKDNFKSSSADQKNPEINIKRETIKMDQNSSTMSKHPGLISSSEKHEVPTKIPANSKIIINEPLYFIHNTLLTMIINEKKIAQILSEFYHNDDLEEALEIVQSEFGLIEIDPRTMPSKTENELVDWMKNILSLKLDENVVFASKNLSRVPSILSKALEDIQKDSVCWTREKLLKTQIESQLKKLMEITTSFESILKSLNEKEIYQREIKNTASVKIESNTHASNKENSSSEEDVMNIDIRVQKPRKQ